MFDDSRSTLSLSSELVSIGSRCSHSQASESELSLSISIQSLTRLCEDIEASRKLEEGDFYEERMSSLLKPNCPFYDSLTGAQLETQLKLIHSEVTFTQMDRLFGRVIELQEATQMLKLRSEEHV